MRAFLAALLAAVSLTACGSGQPVSYAPMAYGQNNQCYYLDDPAEAIALQHAGLCGPTGNYWVPTPMPLLWHQMYYPYYSSPAYYNTYVVVAHRTTFVSTQATFGRTYASQIKTESAQAKYRGSNGKTYTGNRIKPGSFSNGVKGFGSGMKCALGPVTLQIRGGGGSGSGGSRGGFGGGSKGFGSGSKGTGSKAKSKGGC